MNERKQAEADMNSSASRETKLLKAEVHVLDSSFKYNVEFPPETTTKELIEALINELHLPIRNRIGTPHVWKLRFTSSDENRFLHSTEVLGDLMTESSIVLLFFTPETAAG